MYASLLATSIQMSFCEDDLTGWCWFRSLQPGPEAPTVQQLSDDSTEGFAAIQDAAHQVYTPTEADSGYTLMVQCIPKARSDIRQLTVFMCNFVLDSSV